MQTEHYLNPIDVRFVTQTMSVGKLVDLIKNGQVSLLFTSYRRANMWNDIKQSQFIESLLLQIPLPAVYLDASNEDCWEIIDGFQRLYTLYKFLIAGTLKLKDLQYFPDLEDSTYNELAHHRRKILNTECPVHILDPCKTLTTIHDVYERISGSSKKPKMLVNRIV